MTKHKGFFGTAEEEETLNEMSEEDYEAMQRCPNCGETSEMWLDRFPERRRGTSFVNMKCLSCGRYFSITKNWRRTHPKRAEPPNEFRQANPKESPNVD